MIPEYKFTNALAKIWEYSKEIGLEIVDTSKLDPFFKGDLNGVNIWIAATLPDEEELFNVLHLIGHSVQWNVSKELRALGSVLHNKPTEEVLKALQEYEWEANCYGLYALHQVGVHDLDGWLYAKYIEDMFYLTHYYKTGEKLKQITDISLAYSFTKPLKPLKIPKFEAYANAESRNGIVIDFN